MEDVRTLIVFVSGVGALVPVAVGVKILTVIVHVDAVAAWEQVSDLLVNVGLCELLVASEGVGSADVAVLDSVLDREVSRPVVDVEVKVFFSSWSSSFPLSLLSSSFLSSSVSELLPSPDPPSDPPPPPAGGPGGPGGAGGPIKGGEGGPPGSKAAPPGTESGIKPQHRPHDGPRSGSSAQKAGMIQLLLLLVSQRSPWHFQTLVGWLSGSTVLVAMYVMLVEASALLMGKTCSSQCVVVLWKLDWLSRTHGYQHRKIGGEVRLG